MIVHNHRIFSIFFPVYSLGYHLGECWLVAPDIDETGKWVSVTYISAKLHLITCTSHSSKYYPWLFYGKIDDSSGNRQWVYVPFGSPGFTLLGLLQYKWSYAKTIGSKTVLIPGWVPGTKLQCTQYVIKLITVCCTPPFRFPYEMSLKI